MDETSNPPSANGSPVGAHPQGVRMELSRIIISELQDQQIIVLHEMDGARQFPIVIGSPEAMAINRRLKGEMPARPLTHDLLANTVSAMGGTIDRIEIHNLENHTFFARVIVRRPTQLSGPTTPKDASDTAGHTEWIEIDSRPSDAIAVGVASNVPVYVAGHILDEVC
ncbi:MAG: bifunctional nuclease family protein [Planctomycetota bacterium]